MKKVSYFLVGLFGFSFGFQMGNAFDQVPNIVGGITVRSQSPFSKSTVAILGADGDVKCSGTIIGPKTILTAAHCQKHFNGYVGVGTDMVGGNPTVIKIADSKIHELYEDGQADHDVAVLVLTSPLPPGTVPVTLAEYENQSLVGEKATGVGFGKDRIAGGLDIDGKMKEGHLKIKAKDRNTITTDEAGRESMCFGDSGGSLYVEEDGHPVLVGITSQIMEPHEVSGQARTSRCTPDGTSYTKFARVDTHRNWILSQSQRLAGRTDRRPPDNDRDGEEEDDDGWLIPRPLEKQSSTLAPDTSWFSQNSNSGTR